MEPVHLAAGQDTESLKVNGPTVTEAAFNEAGQLDGSLPWATWLKAW